MSSAGAWRRGVKGGARGGLGLCDGERDASEHRAWGTSTTWPGGTGQVQKGAALWHGTVERDERGWIYEMPLNENESMNETNESMNMNCAVHGRGLSCGRPPSCSAPPAAPPPSPLPHRAHRACCAG